MKGRKNKTSHIPLVHALAWIVGSALVISGMAHWGIKYFLTHRLSPSPRTLGVIQTIVQTGPQKEALKTEYLAELLGISSDFPPPAATFSTQIAEEKLRASPLIAEAHVRLVQPSTLYVDYTVRQPVAWLSDYENVALDKMGYLFPFRPFFSPKNLPEIYLGLGPFGAPAESNDKPIAQWNQPLTGKYVELALALLHLLREQRIQELFSVKRIDVSKAFVDSYGTREIVVITEDLIPLQEGEREIHHVFPKILRLSTKNYASDLGNFLKLRERLVEQERMGIHPDPNHQGIVRHKETIIDLRISNLAFIADPTQGS